MCHQQKWRHAEVGLSARTRQWRGCIRELSAEVFVRNRVPGPNGILSKDNGHRRLHQPQTKMSPHASTQHFGRPQGRRAFDGQHLTVTKCGGAAQNGSHIACILQSVQHHGRHTGQDLLFRRPSHHKAHSSRRFQAAQTGK